MLSTNPTSSIQRRRQLHRRQQSLEVPILATPLPANPRRTKPAAHRRGLSLDQSLSTHTSPSGFRPLLPQDQDQDQFQGHPPVRIKIDNTDTGHQQDQQHFVQETQQHRPVQPGYQAQDFQSHLQQQLRGAASPSIVAPTPTHPHQQQALQDLQNHLEWYQQNYGISPVPNMQQANSFNFINVNQPVTGEMAMNPLTNVGDVQMQQPQQLVVRMHTPVSHGHSHTVPNTPQQYAQSWPSPPATEPKHLRTQSFQLDVSPMPTSFDGGHITNTGSPLAHPQHSFTQDSFTVTGDNAYASSTYSSSIVDASSPGPQFGGPMPTLMEEPTSLNYDGTHDDSDDIAILQATGGASDDFNSPNFIIGGGSIGASPNTRMLHDMGPGVHCIIIDTGITPEDVDKYVSAEDPAGKKWYCLFPKEDGVECGNQFGRRENCRAHVQGHLGDRQFMCEQCDKTFVRQHDMKRHAAIHKDDRSAHQCPCGQGFVRQDALTRHRQRGMCKGTLPGFEKKEEDRPKRGRPKKNRPDNETRAAKANKARKMDRQIAKEKATDAHTYASSSSAMSERSLPVTPPDTSDFDADAFIHMASVDIDYNTATSSWRDTPPTSPLTGYDTSPVKSISPAMLTNDCPSNVTSYASPFNGGSSPVNGHEDLFSEFTNFGTIDSHPGVSSMDLFSDAEYTDMSSPFDADYSTSQPNFEEENAKRSENFGNMEVSLRDFIDSH